jgi:hypothetical protein
MVSWPSASLGVAFCSGRSLKRTLLVLLFLAAPALAQNAPRQVTARPPAHRINEMRLAGLRPGRDTAAKALALYGKPNGKNDQPGSQLTWGSSCQTQALSIDLDESSKIQVIRATEQFAGSGDCAKLSPGIWRTGNGLRVGDSAKKVADLYGQPDSRSPSTRDGQPLELWYYAFDWAGADVPQVMEVLCTRETDGKAGRVVEITLAAPSL